MINIFIVSRNFILLILFIQGQVTWGGPKMKLSASDKEDIKQCVRKKSIKKFRKLKSCRFKAIKRCKLDKACRKPFMYKCKKKLVIKRKLFRKKMEKFCYKKVIP